ncbi:unnamed protein product [Rotaria magnacalcarata]|uniref:Magnesium transport protein CorA n=2 Tax=Rotaria magnacalcarata TaxID=392030 RepID=A0A815J8Q3_9BILA|nr:unnamed protein product [Rotaria magnacalcarata]CAF1636311.1 unnamed protein product [Rotaria magnacalcarata]CAF1983853.1 unnamed protein product [Rotaria magnacalcarata]CAF1993645.1 unnamed protein product [Rotaria magnacalcarata]CAF2241603.1 unnamed protein product [Rotaria magnacalcarata]
MPYFNCNDIPILKQHRIRAATNNEHNMLENLAEHSTKINILSKARRSTLIGLPPTLINTSKDLQQNIRVNPTVFFYNEETFQEASYRSIEDIREIKTNECLWIDVTGVHDHDLITRLGRRFNIHPLVVADIETTEQRTKLDVFEDTLFLVGKMIYPDIQQQITHIEQISFYLKENILITFQETSKDIFEPIKNRIRQNKGRIRRSKIDYLFYSLVDRIVDQYMDVLDIIGTKVESIDHQLMRTLSRDTLETIYDLKREMLYFRRSISPLKEIINKLQKEEETQIMNESTNIYLKDLFDHVVQVNDTIDTYREMLSSFIDFYMMLNSNAMNEVVKTLTIISTIFIPLTFVVGVYGMNFENMPEIRWKYGYFVVLGFMVVLAVTMLSCFKRKKWF